MLVVLSGKRLHNYGKSPCYSWVKQLSPWQCSLLRLPLLCGSTPWPAVALGDLSLAVGAMVVMHIAEKVTVAKRTTKHT